MTGPEDRHVARALARLKLTNEARRDLALRNEAAKRCAIEGHQPAGRLRRTRIQFGPLAERRTVEWRRCSRCQGWVRQAQPDG